MCNPGEIYKKDVVKAYLEGLNTEQKANDDKIRIEKYPILADYLGPKKTKNFNDLRAGGLLKQEEIDKLSSIDFKDINNQDYYPWVKGLKEKLSDENLAKIGCKACATCPRGFLRIH